MTLDTARLDLGAAFVGALTTLPQAVAYGLIAVSPLGPEWAAFGITASVGSSILFGFVAGLLGSNRFLISGPGAVSALILASAVQAGLDRGLDPTAALALAFMGLIVAGAFQAAAGLLRLGHIVSYIPVPVLAGFASASALIVFLNALPIVLGLPGGSLRALWTGGPGAIGPWAAVVGGLTIASTFALEGRLKWIPPTLAALALGTLTYTLGYRVLGLPDGPLIGAIDIAGLWHTPFLIEAGFAWSGVWKAADIPLLTGLSIGLLCSFSTVIAAGALRLRTGGESDDNRDLWIHGVLNALMGVLGFLPASGTVSRSTAMVEAGATGRAANAGSAVVFGLMLAGLAPLVAALPLWATAGMLVATALQAVDRPTLEKAWNLVARRIPYPRVVAGDVLVTLTVVVTGLAFDLIAAVGVGVALSVVLFVLGMGRNPVRRVFLGSRIHSKIQRPPAQSDWLEKEGRRIAVIELQGALFFGSCALLQSEARKLLDEGVEYLVLDFRHLSSIDSTGSAALRSLNVTFAETGGHVFVSYVEPERRTAANGNRRPADRDGAVRACRRERSVPRWIWLNLEANGVVYALGHEQFFGDTDGALARCEDLLITRFGKSGLPGFRGVIASSPLFAGLSRDQIAQLGRWATRRHFRAGDIVFRQGDAGDRAYFLVHGRMDVLIDIPGTSRKKRVSALTEGTLFGEVGMIDRAPRSASVVASHQSVCFAIDGEGFQILRAENPDLVAVLLLNLSHLLASRLRLADIMISELEQ